MCYQKQIVKEKITWEGIWVKVYRMVEISSVFHKCGREKSKEVSIRVETLNLEQSDDMGNNWLGHVGSESINSGSREWAYI